MTKLTLKQLEPFAHGYLHCESENISMRIASGLYSLCENVPIDIRPETRLASLDRAHAGSVVNRMGIIYDCGCGMQCKEYFIRDEMEKYPEYKEKLSAYLDYFKNLVTYDIFKKTCTQNELDLMANNSLWGGTWGGHANPDYGMFVALGTEKLREKVLHYKKMNPEAREWYNASLLILDAVDLLGERYRDLSKELMTSDAENAHIYQRIYNALQTVPKKPATDFMTACQSFALIFYLDGRDTPGAFDQYMGQYFTDSEEDNEILEGLWQEFHRTRTWNLCISGSDEHWNDKTNALSYAILRTAKKYKYNTPNLTMRCHRNTPEELLDLAVSVIGTGIGMPVLYNDEVVCPALEALGIPPEDSHLYAMNGCNQIDIQGKSHMGLEDGEICLLKCLEYALHNGKCLITDKVCGPKTGDAKKVKSFDELFDLYKKQVAYAVKTATSLSNRSQKAFSENAPNPLRSMLIEGCLEKGKDYKSGGPLYNFGQILTEALADTADSLINIKHFVFDTNKYTMEEVIDALEKDFEGYEEMYDDFRSSPLKFGNDIEEVDTLCAVIHKHYFEELMKYKTFRDSENGTYGGGLSTFQRTGRYGSSCGASASGRHKGDVNIADSIGAVPGMDVHGPTALLKSVMHYDQTLAKSGFVMQMKFDKQMFNSQRGKTAFKAIVKTYFKNGGQQLTSNVLDSAELQDALLHPENHQNLVVRVGGYSDYFVNLSDALKENIINRTIISL